MLFVQTDCTLCYMPAARGLPPLEKQAFLLLGPSPRYRGSQAVVSLSH